MKTISIVRGVGSIVALLALGACASGPSPAVPVETAAETVPAPAEPLPKVPLTGDVLHDVLLGEIAGRRGEFSTSVRALGRAAKATGDPRLAERATLAGIYAKQYKEALEVGELWVSLRPGDDKARKALANILLELNRPAEAQLQLEKVLEIARRDGQEDKAYLEVAAALGRHTNQRAALEIMQTLTRRSPQNAQAQFALAHLAFRAGDTTSASAAVDRALLLKPDWEEAALLKVRLLTGDMDKTRATAFYRDYLKRHPKATRVRMSYARELVDSQQWDKAREQFAEVLRYKPGDADVLYALGLLSLQNNQLDDAETYLAQANKIDPRNESVRLYMGQVMERKKRYAEALKWYGSISDDKYVFEAQVRAAVTTSKQGKLDEARKALHAVAVESDDERVQIALAEEQILREAKRYSEAFDVLDRALKQLPRHKDLLYARALVAEKLNALDVHERDLRLLIKLDPKNAHALNALGYTLADRTNRHQEALDLIRQALALRPRDPFILDSMGWVHYRLGDTREAIRYLREALSIRSDAEISAHLGEVLWIAGNRGEAQSVWDRALKETPDNELLRETVKKFRK
jgi:tetratricopeptide (TPR) repeat protein